MASRVCLPRISPPSAPHAHPQLPVEFHTSTDRYARCIVAEQILCLTWTENHGSERVEGQFHKTDMSGGKFYI